MRLLTILIAFGSFVSASHALTHHVGPGQTYTRIQPAAAAAAPGDTILLHAGVYGGGDGISAQGTADAWITIRAEEPGSVIFRGGGLAMHLQDAAYLRIEGLVFEEQTGNGLNIDDGGTMETPTHHIIIENCEWRGMDATGNNDELKLSGLDDFLIRNCRFLNGSPGGSQVDMVGCHRGEFVDNLFVNAGSNAIQAKGGSSYILIWRNRFINGGQRAINIGGSTGLEFFRPQGALAEASYIYVHSNLFEGSVAPIAYVGAIQSEVVNNTIIRPERWAIRILQETTEPGFLPCGNNVFRNNIVVFNSQQPAINIGPDTAPESFTFTNNLWYNPDNASWSGPNTPVMETGRILNLDPQFADTSYRLSPTSPAIGAGETVVAPLLDLYGKPFRTPRSIGAVEFAQANIAQIEPAPKTISIMPNPASRSVAILPPTKGPVIVLDVLGQEMWSGTAESAAHVDVSSWSAGEYLVISSGMIAKLIKR